MQEYDSNFSLDYLYQEIVIKKKMDALNLKLSSSEFVGFAIKILYEMIYDDKIRYLFLYLLSKIIINSDYNKSFISSNHITEKLFFLLRVEQNQEIRNFISETLYEIIKDFAKVINNSADYYRLTNFRNLIFV